MGDLLPFTLILLVASIPVALPATFTLAAALGSGELAKRNVLVVRLSTVEEAASMDVLCSDKTGTITQNSLTLAATHAYDPYGDDELLPMAAICSESATQDPIDLAILQAAQARGIAIDPNTRLTFTPFDSSTKYSAVVAQEGATPIRIVKGFPQAVGAMAGHTIDGDVAMLAGKGYRVLAVAAGQDKQMHLVGLLALEDPPRPDSKDLLERLTLGVGAVVFGLGLDFLKVYVFRPRLSGLRE